MDRVKSVKELQERINHLLRVVLVSGNKRDITAAFKALECLITGSCICDLCPEWDKDVEILYEFSRCLVPPRILQLIKSRHSRSKRWEYIQPLYASLYEKLFDDILPSTPHMADVKYEQKVKCKIHLSKEVIDDAFDKIKQEGEQRLKRFLRDRKKQKA
jgi:hypothetical protein